MKMRISMKSTSRTVFTDTAFDVGSWFSNAYAQSADKQETKLPEIQVTSDKEAKYVVKQTSTATKTDTLLRDTPQAITVVTQEQIRDQAMQKHGGCDSLCAGESSPAQGEGNRDTAVFRGNSSTGDFL